LAFDRPTLKTLISRVEGDLEGKLAGADPRLRRSVEYVLARVLAGASHGLHGHLDWLSRQVLPDRAEDEFVLRWANTFGVQRLPATKSGGSITVTGVLGTTVPAGAVWQRKDQVEYVVTADTDLGVGDTAIPVQAKVAGVAGDADGGVVVNLAAGIAGVNPAAVFDDEGATGGAELEAIEALRDRVLFRIRTPPKGGGPGDYVAWAREVSGITRAWEFPAYLGLGTVGVFIARDDDGDGPIPSAPEVAAVQAHIDALAPVTARVTVFAPVAHVRNFTITPVPNTAAVRAAIEAQLRDLLRREAVPGGTIPLTHVREAISLARGETDHILTSPVADLVDVPGELSTFGVITWP
jgi:uncharacterized phage protein gp47/JayE